MLISDEVTLHLKSTPLHSGCETCSHMQSLSPSNAPEMPTHPYSCPPAYHSKHPYEVTIT